MTTIIDPQTQAALQNIGCLVNNKLDNAAFTALLVQQLETSHIAADLNAVPAAEITVGQLVANIVGVVDDQLVDAVKPLLNTGAGGRVQKNLTNGHVLCAGRAHTTVTVGSQSYGISAVTRFLSDDPDVIERHVLDPRQRRATSFVDSTLELTAMVEDRQPAMSAAVAAFTQNLAATWQRALTPPAATP